MSKNFDTEELLHHLRNYKAQTERAKEAARLKHNFNPGILIKQAAKRQLVKEVMLEWYRQKPKQAKEIIKFIQECTFQDYNPTTGAWRGEGDDLGYCKVRFPQELFLHLRAVIPGWGDDDADLKDFFREFPDMIPKNLKRRFMRKDCGFKQ
jgi:hypothetical protein